MYRKKYVEDLERVLNHTMSSQYVDCNIRLSAPIYSSPIIFVATGRGEDPNATHEKAVTFRKELY